RLDEIARSRAHARPDDTSKTTAWNWKMPGRVILEAMGRNEVSRPGLPLATDQSCYATARIVTALLLLGCGKSASRTVPDAAIVTVAPADAAVVDARESGAFVETGCELRFPSAGVHFVEHRALVVQMS